jgi:hypothetical protein
MRSVAVILLATAMVVACVDRASGDPNRMTAPMRAADVAREIELAQEVTPLPQGAAWKSIELDPNASYGELSGLSMIEFQALCAWLIEANAAAASNDVERLADAGSILVTVPTWRSFSDPVTTVPDFRALIVRVVRSAASDDPRDAQSFTASNCEE